MITKRTIKSILASLYLIFFTLNCSDNNSQFDLGNVVGMRALLVENFKRNFDAVDDLLIKGNSNTFVEVDHDFQGEYLVYPHSIKVNPFNKNEIYISDWTQNCVFVITLDKKFVRKIGQSGQGPGDLQRPKQIDVDKLGNVYVNDTINQRISIFLPNGKFKQSLRVTIPLESSFYVINENEILCNLPRSGYYFTILNLQGEPVSQFGEISKYSDVETDYIFGQGFPIYDEKNDYYYIFLSRSGLVRIYDGSEKFIKEIDIGSKIPSTKAYKDSGLLLPLDKSTHRVGTILWFTNVSFDNDSFIITAMGNTISDFRSDEGYPLGLYVFNKDFVLKKVLLSPVPMTVLDEIKIGGSARQIGFILEKNIVLIPGGKTAEILISEF